MPTATAQNILEKAGFTVRTIGNAKNQTYESTIIYYQTGQLSNAQKIGKALTSYSITYTESSLASPDAVLVVIGLK